MSRWKKHSWAALAAVCIAFTGTEGAHAVGSAGQKMAPAVPMTKQEKQAVQAVVTVPEGYQALSYNAQQVQAMTGEFAKFAGFTTVYAPKLMTQGDHFLRAVASDDGVNFVFDHMLVSISPRDYSSGYDGTSVTLDSGLPAKWIAPGDTPLLVFRLDDNCYLMLASFDHSLTRQQLELVGASISKGAK
jgi:hypothetical protein